MKILIQSILFILLAAVLFPFFYLLIKEVSRRILRSEIRFEKKLREDLQQKSSRYYKEINSLNSKNKILKNKLLRIEYLLKERIHKNAIVTYETTNKGVDTFVALVINNSRNKMEIEIFDIECDFFAKHRELVLWCEKMGNEYFIADIQGGNGNGHGEIAMKKLIELAEKENISKIIGELVPADFLNRDRQIAFYEKMGFNIYLNDSRTEGYIEKKI
ncbi:GNAT family N-acetyltransferase [Chryseobacterium oncorhynchi]|uniref:Uncharacterized protein n=1 Tax=Chryseobacterium oncorhynchi TaxID=741074 RepID=A0A316WT61_9FLAO|nr:GNAT family N-acetyltransferase [Chryseobacterium oncorhynchi]PWN64349.1 hypothetical protein C1638_010590 [Chryseobacterium oncorhynchi]